MNSKRCKNKTIDDKKPKGREGERWEKGNDTQEIMKQWKNEQTTILENQEQEW